MWRKFIYFIIADLFAYLESKNKISIKLYKFDKYEF